MSEIVQASRLTPVFRAEEIRKAVGRIARDIDARYGGEPLVMICVLKGAFMFFSDLARSLENPLLELDFVRLSSYGMNSASSKHVIFSKDIETDIRGKHALIVEDIVDSGHTMRFLLDQLAARRPASVAVAALVDKSGRREADVEVAFSGFGLPDGFLVGYGMDYAERFRGLPDICELENLKAEVDDA